MSSSTEAGPSARSASVDSSHGPPVQQFDANLRLLTESYLSFFQERRRIEEQYVDALHRLHKRLKTTDTYFDDKFDPSFSRNTTRVAWAEIRDNVERETETRQAFIASLSTEVISPLVSLKETEERIRKRIREDLKDAINAHNEYVEGTFQKFKRSYLKKSQDAEDMRNATAAAGPLSPTAVYEHNPFVLPKSGQSTGKPIVTAPQPLRPLDRRPSTAIGPVRNRSPSTSTALQDLAHQGKRQLNQLMTFLDKGGNMKDGNRADNALRTVRAKREAEDADKEYRKAVHWVETLRLRRVKILEGGYNSLESFVRELSETMKHVLQTYSDSIVATSMTQAQISEHASNYVGRISPEKDVSLLTVNIPRLLTLATPKPQYYENFTVGECRDLIFGVSLVDYATAKGLGEGDVPKIIRICIKEIEERGLDAEGIYRVSGRHASVQELQHKIERDEDAFEFNAPTDDVYAVSSLLKLYLRELPEPLFRFPLQDRMQHSEDLEDHISSNFRLLRSKMRRLPPVHQATLKAIVEHLSKVTSHIDKNKMDAKNLAIVFGSVIFGEDDMMPKGGDLLSVQSWKDTLMEDLITHANVLFQTNNSPQLPPAPSGEPVPAISYGSAHTRVSEMLPPPVPRPATPDKRPKELPPHPGPSTPALASASIQAPLVTERPDESTSHLPLRAMTKAAFLADRSEDFTPQLPPRPANKERSEDFTPQLPPRPANKAALLFERSEDFTPQLPLRPANSIHPSLRAGPMSGLPSRQSLPAPARNAQWFDETITFADVTPAAPSVPPSPSRNRLQRAAPSPLPLKSPWSESQPSLASTSSATHSPTSADDADAAPANVISLNDDDDDDDGGGGGPLSAPSTATTFASASALSPGAVSPTASLSSAGRRTPLTPPPLAHRPLATGTLSRTPSISPPGSSRHRKAASTSSASASME